MWNSLARRAPPPAPPTAGRVRHTGALEAFGGQNVPVAGKSKRPNRRPAPGSPAGGPTAARASAVPAPQLANRVTATTAPGLVRLSALPKLLVPMSTAVALLVGAAVGGMFGLVLLSAVAALLGWLLLAFWPVTPASGRLLRIAVVLGVALLGVLRAG
jgi:hypothetical protein